MACCYIAAACIAGLVKMCHFLDIDEKIHYNDRDQVASGPDFASMVSHDPAVPLPNSTATVLSLSNLTCAACVDTVERALESLDDVREARVSLGMQQAWIDRKTGGSQDVSRLVQAVRDVGYGCDIGPRSREETMALLRSKEELSKLRSSFSGLATFAMLIQAATIAARYFDTTSSHFMRGMTAGPLRIVATLLAINVQSTHAAWVHRDSGTLIKAGRANMNTLISLSAILGLSFTLLDTLIHGPLESVAYNTTVTGLTLVVVAGRYLDVVSRREASKHLANLHDPLANVRDVTLHDSGQTVSSTFLRRSDTIRIAPFDSVPCDGYIINGNSFINQAVVTGEPKPVAKGVGDFLLAGTQNLQGTLVCVVHREQHESFYAQLVRSVVDATTRKLQYQGALSAVTRYFVGTAVALAIIAPTVSIWRRAIDTPEPLDIYSNLREFVDRAMAVLTSACPCALGLAVPSAVVAAIDAAQRKGILLTRGASTIEELNRLSHLVFDKTGTLTEGTLEVETVQLQADWVGQESTFWTLVCALEEHEETGHPVGNAVFKKGIQELGNRWLEWKGNGRVSNAASTPGRGVRGNISIGESSWVDVCVGSERYMEDCEVQNKPSASSACAGGGLTVHVGINGRYVGLIILQDTIRSNANRTLRQLTSMGYKCSMLTGDSDDEAERVSAYLDIPLLASEAMPKQKVDHIQQLKANGATVAMIGDGLNDAPSLAHADVGVILAQHSFAATVGGSVMLLNSNLECLPLAFEIAKQTARQIRMNLVWAAAYNVIVLSLATRLYEPFGWVITPSVGAMLMSSSSIAMSLQSLALRARLDAINFEARK